MTVLLPCPFHGVTALCHEASPFPVSTPPPLPLALPHPQPENVLLDDHGNVKLTGFALAGLFDPSLGADVTNLLHASCGTPEYAAPEVRRRIAQWIRHESIELARPRVVEVTPPAREKTRGSLRTFPPGPAFGAEP